MLLRVDLIPNKHLPTHSKYKRVKSRPRPYLQFMVTEGSQRFFCGVGKCLTRAFAIRCWVMFTEKPSDNDDVDTQRVGDGEGYLIQQVTMKNW